MQKRRFLMISAVLVLLLCLLPVTALAADGAITAGGQVQVSAVPGEYTEYSYTFTAPKTAVYTLWYEPWEGSIYFDVGNSDGYYVAGNSGRCQFSATKGESYTIDLQVWSWSDMGTSATVYLEESVSVTSISFGESTYTGFLGGEYPSVYVTGTVQPVNGFVDGTWTSSNPSVADIVYADEYEIGASIEMKSVGTTTITFTNNNGVKASCKVVVKEIKTVAMGDSVQYSIAPGESEGYIFTAPSDGFYYFDRDSGVDEYYNEDVHMMINGELYNVDGTEYSGIGFYSSREFIGLRQGKKYTVEIKNEGSSTVSGVFEIHKAVAATTMEIDGSNSVGKGYYHYYFVEFGPDYAVSETVTWTSSNPSVLKIVDQWSNACETEALSLGTAVLTAKSESGLTAKMTVTVKEQNYGLEGDPLVLGAANKVDLADENEMAVFEVTPSRSGYYHFDHDANVTVVIGVIKNNQESVTGIQIEKTDGGYLCWLDAGEDYYIYSYYYPDYQDASYNIYVNRVSSSASGWVKMRGGWFYFQNSKPVEGWQKIDGKWYYFYEELLGNAMAKGLIEIDGKWYYLNNEMKTGWQSIDGKWYYFGTDGAMKTGWVQVSGKWYYMNSNGIMQTGWQSIDGKWYYLNSSGVMQTGWVQVSGKWYYLNSSGVMQIGWVQVSGKWYYLNSSGVMQTGWQKIDGKWYYLNSDMKTGWQRIDGSWYYLDSYMKTGWQKIDGSWYYLGSNGVMRTGWQYISGSWYYLGTNGIMVTGTHVIDGVTYTFNSSGAMVK